VEVTTSLALVPEMLLLTAGQHAQGEGAACFWHGTCCSTTLLVWVYTNELDPRRNSDLGRQACWLTCAAATALAASPCMLSAWPSLLLGRWGTYCFAAMSVWFQVPRYTCTMQQHRFASQTTPKVMHSKGYMVANM
jgi:hypothetical protein